MIPTTGFIPPPVAPLVPALNTIVPTGGALGKSLAGAALGGRLGAALGPKGALAGALAGALLAPLLFPSPLAPGTLPPGSLDPGLNDPEPSPSGNPGNNLDLGPLPGDPAGTAYFIQIGMVEHRTAWKAVRCPPQPPSEITGNEYWNTQWVYDWYQSISLQTDSATVTDLGCGGGDVDNTIDKPLVTGKLVDKYGREEVIEWMFRKDGTTSGGDYHTLDPITTTATLRIIIDGKEYAPEPEPAPVKPRPTPIPIIPLPVIEPEPAPIPLPEPEPQPEPLVVPSPDSPKAPPITIPKAPPAPPQTPKPKQPGPITVPRPVVPKQVPAPLPIPGIPTVPEPSPEPNIAPAPSPDPAPKPGPAPIPGPAPEPSPDPEPGVTPIPTPPITTPIIRPTPAPAPVVGTPTKPDGNLVPRPAPLPKPTPPNVHFPVPGMPPITDGGMRNDITAIAKEVGRIEQKTAKTMESLAPINWELMQLIYDILKDLWPGDQINSDTYLLTGVCEELDDEGNQPVFSTPVLGGDPFTAVVSRLDAMQDLLQAHLRYKTPTCGPEKPKLEGSWVTAQWISDQASSDSPLRLRKRTRYRSKSGRSDAELAAYFCDFVWEAGPVCVIHKDSWWGVPQVWAASVDEGKRVIRHLAGEAGINPDSTGRWQVSGSSNPRIGRTGTMRLRTIDGFPWVSSRDDSNMLPMG